MAQYRYRSSKNPAGTTHRALQWLGEEKQISAIVAWVMKNLEPLQADHLVIDDDDIPDLFDMLTFEFEDVVTVSTIDKAIWSLPQISWVRRGHPRIGGSTSKTKPPVEPKFGTPRELQARAELATRLAKLEQAILAYKTAIGPINHNRPNIGIELDEVVPPSIVPLEAAVLELRAEMRIDTPSIAKVRVAAKRMGVWAKAWRWFIEKADRAANSIVDKTGHLVFAGILATGLLGCGDEVALCASSAGDAAEQWVTAAQNQDGGAGTERTRKKNSEAPRRTKVGR